MREDELVRKIRELVVDPRRATSASSWPGNHWIDSAVFPPAPPSVIQDALQRFGFPIPSLLSRLWSEVANGGIGPGYGIYGVEGE